MRRLVRSLRAAESGEALVEYAFLVAVIGVALIGVLHAFRQSVERMTGRTAVTISSQGAGYGSTSPDPAPVVAGGPGGGFPNTSIGQDEDEDEAEPDDSPPDSLGTSKPWEQVTHAR